MATRASQERVHTASEMAYTNDKKEIDQVERVLSADDGKVDHLNYDRIDDEVAKYADANADAVHISEEENKRLKRLIDKRVLPVMIVTYFLQSLDKGTMSFSSIMGIRNDIPILKQNYYVSLPYITYRDSFTNSVSGVGLQLAFTLPF
jgi:septin family protein